MNKNIALLTSLKLFSKHELLLTNVHAITKCHARARTGSSIALNFVLKENFREEITEFVYQRMAQPGYRNGDGQYPNSFNQQGAYQAGLRIENQSEVS